MAVKMKLEQIGEVYAITASIEDFERIFATHKAECVGEILDKAFSYLRINKYFRKIQTHSC